MNPKEIRARYDQLVSDRKVAEEAWDLIERFIYPLGGGRFFETLSTEGEINWRRRYLYDDTAILGADSLAASIHGSLTSPAVKWFDLMFEHAELNDDITAKTWLEECGRICWNTIQQSNFNLEVSEGYLDLVSFGNTMMTQHPVDELTWRGMQFDSIPLRDIYFDEDQNGQVRALYRKLQWKPSQVVSKFGDKTPERIKSLAQNTAVSNKIEIVFCVYPIEANASSDTSGILSKEKRPYGYKYILHDSAEQIGDIGGYYEMPAYMVRWRRTAGSQWGYGPGHLALSTTMTLNELVKLVLESAEKVVDPPSLVSRRGVLSDLDLSAGGQTIVHDINNAMKPYESGARFDVSALQIADLRQMIRQLFHVDQLELKESPAMSATEVMVRYELMNRLLGPTMGRLQSDLLDPLVKNTFKMLYRAKQFPTVPTKVAQSGNAFKVDYVGPLSRAQKSDEVQSVERWLGNLANLTQIFPELRHVPDPKQIAIFMADGLNVPAKLMRTDSQINTLIAKDKKNETDMMNMQKQAANAEVTNLEKQSTQPG